MKRRTIWTLLAATAFEALRFGAGTFRVIVDLPARHRIGAVAFAELSRATDLSAAGIAFYATYGIGGALVTVIALIAAWRAEAPLVVRRLTAVAAIASVLVLVLTTRAAPLMWRIGSSPNDAVVLGGLLDEFTTWTVLRVLCADASFFAMLAALGHAALHGAIDARDQGRQIETPKPGTG